MDEGVEVSRQRAAGDERSGDRQAEEYLLRRRKIAGWRVDYSSIIHITKRNL
jgi:hypothetical protein